MGLTQAGRLHYFPSKQDLFVEVLRVRDELDEAKADDIIEASRLAMQHNAEVAGLVHLFMTVSAEAVNDEHSGRAHFQERYDRLVGLLRTRIRTGQKDGTVTKAISVQRRPTARARGPGPIPRGVGASPGRVPSLSTDRRGALYLNTPRTRHLLRERLRQEHESQLGYGVAQQLHLHRPGG